MEWDTSEPRPSHWCTESRSGCWAGSLVGIRVGHQRAVKERLVRSTNDLSACLCLGQVRLVRHERIKELLRD
eukprot:scaffold130861_cov63-Phaeocystis_antarctica.AAC.1